MTSRRRPVIAPVAVLAIAFALTSCGATSDRDKITAIMQDVGHHPAHLCTTYATAPLLARAGGPAACQSAASAADAVDPGLRVLSVRITGTTATAKVQGRSGQNTIGLAKVGSDWKISKAG
jgi:predicted lipoprotein